MDEALDTSLLRIARAVLGAQELSTIIKSALETFSKLIPAWRHSIGLIDERAGTYTVYAVHGASVDAWTTGMPVPLSEFGGDLERLRTGQAQLDRDLRTADGVRRAGRMQGIGAQLLTPVIHGERLLATLNVGTLETQQLDEAHVEIAVQVSDLLAQALRQHELQQELAQAHAGAIDASRAKSVFLATISHEIRTPLNAILGLSELLSRRLAHTPEAELTRTIHESARGLLGLINDVLDFSKGAAGELELELRSLDLRELIASTLRMFELSAEERGLRLWSDVDPRLPAALEGDELRLRQVLLNLVSNAIKFTEQGSVGVRVEVDEVDEGAKDVSLFMRLSVIDTGVGIDPAAQAKIFDPFVQADAGVTRRAGGTGLGLAICRQIAEAMGGSLTLDSVLGEGSTFTVCAPIRACRALGRAGDPAADEVARPCWRVLVVDDNPVNRLVAQALLEEAGQLAVLAPSGVEALELLIREPIDIVLMDCLMPQMDGYETTRRIRAGEAGRRAQRLPIIAVTANALPADRAAAQAAGMDGHLPKPVSRAALVGALDHYLCASTS